MNLINLLCSYDKEYSVIKTLGCNLTINVINDHVEMTLYLNKQGSIRFKDFKDIKYHENISGENNWYNISYDNEKGLLFCYFGFDSFSDIFDCIFGYKTEEMKIDNLNSKNLSDVKSLLDVFSLLSETKNKYVYISLINCDTITITLHYLDTELELKMNDRISKINLSLNSQVKVYIANSVEKAEFVTLVSNKENFVDMINTLFEILI